MPNLNKCLIAGHLGRDAEFSTTTGGYPIGRCSVAVTSRVKRGGEWGEEVEWFKVVLLGERYTKIQDRLTKGCAVFVEGRIQTRTWEKDGQKHYMTELLADNLQLLGGGTGATGRAGHSPRSDRRDVDPSPSVPLEDDSDSVPF